MHSDMRELDGLLDYTIRHNKEHAEELKNLAKKADTRLDQPKGQGHRTSSIYPVVIEA